MLVKICKLEKKRCMQHLFFPHFGPFPLANLPFLPPLWFCSMMVASFCFLRTFLVAADVVLLQVLGGNGWAAEVML